MNEVRYASLSSGLLARKGTAKPAMRPQGFTGGFEDLGWNDMGHDSREERPVPVEHVPSSIAALTPIKGGRSVFGLAEPVQPEVEPELEPEAVEAETVEPTVTPAIVVQQRAIAERFEEEAEAEVAPTPVSVSKPVPAKVVALPTRPAVQSGRKAAFTLRLDADRHMRLRLACAIEGRSAQQVVTSALDAALAAIPEIESLAMRMPASSSKRN